MGLKLPQGGSILEGKGRLPKGFMDEPREHSILGPVGDRGNDFWHIRHKFPR